MNRDLSALIRGQTPREIAGFSDNHYKKWQTTQDQSNTSLIQIEHDVFDDHPRISGQFERLYYEEPEDYYFKYSWLDPAIHGTAVASIVSCIQTGICPGVKFYFSGLSKRGIFSDPAADPYEPIRDELGQETDPIINVLEGLLKKAKDPLDQRVKKGDIVSVSVQAEVVNELYSTNTTEPEFYTFPIDCNKDIAKLINGLVDAGLIVFIAAGNGGLDLDKFVPNSSAFKGRTYAQMASRSKAVKVAYVGNWTHRRHFSNYGNCVEFFAPSGAVRTACYTYDEDSRTTDLVQTFTGTFGKTSAATPILAAIAAKVQKMWKLNNLEQSLSRTRLVEFLKQNASFPNLTGISIEDAKNVGVFPSAQVIESQFN